MKGGLLPRGQPGRSVTLRNAQPVTDRLSRTESELVPSRPARPLLLFLLLGPILSSPVSAVRCVFILPRRTRGRECDTYTRACAITFHFSITRRSVAATIKITNATSEWATIERETLLLSLVVATNERWYRSSLAFARNHVSMLKRR